MEFRLARSVFMPEGSPKAAVVIVHGMAEHRKRYDEFANFLSETGYLAITYDLPGHGESTVEGYPLGYFGEEDGWETLVASARDIILEIKKEFPELPVSVFSHSMGTMIARCLIQECDNQIDSLIMSGTPCYNSASGFGMVLTRLIRRFYGKKGLSKTLDNLTTGAFNKSVKNPETQVDWISYNCDNVQAYLKDDLCGFPFTIEGYYNELEGMKMMNEVDRYACRKPELPILLISGEQDPCTGGTKGLSSSITTLKKAGYKNIENIVYPNMRHEILNEDDRASVFEDVVKFLDGVVKFR